MSRRTKIIATVGPSCWDEAVMRRLVQEGVNVFRLNFSHAKRDQTSGIIDQIRRLAAEEDHNVAILQDLQGPRIRTGDIADPSGSVELVPGQETVLTTRPVKSTNSAEIGIDYQDLPLDVKPGDTVLINDGLLELKVISSDSEDVRCIVITGGPLSSHKGINVPGVTLRVPTITDKDKADLQFGVEKEVDYVALSFVRRGEDVFDLKKLIREYAGAGVPDTLLPRVISKIEKHEAITNFDEILEASDGVMVARGDLGVEMPTEQIPVLQKMIIHRCNKVGKPVITATQMLDSMIRNPHPTRAEATDVANAIIDGTDAIMLSGESASGLYPVEAVRVMSRIAITTEENLLFLGPPKDVVDETATSTTDAISQAVCGIGREIGADALITTTTSGFTARMVSRCRPKLPIYAITHEERTVRRLALVWGIRSYLCPKYESTDEMLMMAEKVLVEKGLLKEGDKVVITAGIPVGTAGQSNLLKVHVVGEN